LVLPSDVEIQGSLTLNTNQPTINWNINDKLYFQEYVNASDKAFVIKRNDSSSGDVVINGTNLTVQSYSDFTGDTINTALIEFTKSDINQFPANGAMWFDGNNYQGHIGGEFYNFDTSN
jgi:hypothetical protein